MSSRDILASSRNPNWRTPGWLREALGRDFPLVLDVAADAENHVTPLWLGPDGALDDALCGVDWWTVAGDEAGAIFMNPPYSQELGLPIAPWIEKAAQAGERGIVIGVVPFAPQTRWWLQFVVGHVYRATEIRRFPFRLKFEPPPDYEGKAPGANVNTAIVIWRPTGAYDSAPWAPHERYWVPEGCPRKRRSRRESVGETIDPDEE